MVEVKTKTQVVSDVLLEAFDRLAHAFKVLVRRSLARQSRNLHLYSAPRFENVANVGLATLRDKSEERRWDVVLDHCYPTCDTALALDDAVVGKEPYGFPNGRLAHSELVGQSSH